MLEFAPLIPGGAAPQAVGDRFPFAPEDAEGRLDLLLTVAEATGENPDNFAVKVTSGMFREEGGGRYRTVGITYGDLAEILAALRS